MEEIFIKPWYKRTTFWLSLLAILQLPYVASLPGVSLIVEIASAILGTALPTTYVAGEMVIKKVIAEKLGK